MTTYLPLYILKTIYLLRAVCSWIVDPFVNEGTCAGCGGICLGGGRRVKGQHRIIVSTRRLRYDFIVRRNLTVIRSDCATGKTTHVDMIQEHSNHPCGSPVELICDKTCFVLTGPLWREQLSGMPDWNRG